MKQVFDIIKQNPLLKNVSLDDFEKMAACLDAVARTFEKGDNIIFTGDRVSHVGLILSGSVKVIKEDVDGNIVILTELGVPELFGEVFACADIDHSPVTVLASEKSEILFINYRKIINTCSSACVFHAKLVENMLSVIARKNLMLNQKIEILSRRTTRERLLMFLDIHRGEAKECTIPFNREEMAHYLCVDRSAMSNELGKMRDDGLIRFHKNTFEILY